MPYEPFSLVVVLIAGLLLAAAWRLIGSRQCMAAALVVIAGGLLRLDSAWQASLHPWDERYHALVAKNFIADPLTPALYRDPALEYDFRDWTSNHIWLHKPPLSMWGMAFTMQLFGVHAITMRWPSVLLSTGTILLTYAIGVALFDRRVALLAATFLSINGFLIALAGGRRVADHVDTWLVFLVALSVWLALRTDRAGGQVVMSGAAVGLGFLAKSFPALIAIPVIFAWLLQQGGIRRATVRTAGAGLVALIVAAPWSIYSSIRWPAEARWEALQTLQHWSQVVESHTSGPLTYFQDLPRFFGELTPVSILLASVWLVRYGLAQRSAVLLVWILVPYTIFSLAATRLPAFVMMSAPAVLLLHAYVWWALRERLETLRGFQRRALAVVLVLMAIAPARDLFEPTGVLERRVRESADTRFARGLVTRLGSVDAVVFNVPNPIEVMFYSPYPAYKAPPTEPQARHLLKSGRVVVVVRRSGEQISLPADLPVMYISGNQAEGPDGPRPPEA